MKVVISGSFRKHMEEIIKLKKQLENDGVDIVKPDNIDVVENPENPEFIKFKGEENKSEQELQYQYLVGIENCDAHIIYNKDGYIGTSALHELFYGAGTNTFSKMNNETKQRAKVYLLERPSIQKLNNAINNQSEDIKRIYNMILALIKIGDINIGIEKMYKDFNIKSVEDLER